MKKLFENWREYEKEVLNEVDLGLQYTPKEFKLENPLRPPGISKEIWDEASRRCLAGESEHCPHKREPWLRDREEETESRPRKGLEPTPIIEPPVPVQWYPPKGSYRKMERAFLKWISPPWGEGPDAVAQVVGSDFVSILNNPGWSVRPEADRYECCGESPPIASMILDYRHSRPYWPSSSRARIYAFESGKHPMSKQKAPFLYNKDKMPNYKEVERHMLRYPWYAEYLLEYFLQLKKIQGGDMNKKPSGISRNRWKSHLTPK
tara:strand:+ start:726 stop:1514 length:789 start_codon:yes stop_codon:yes gene_type:complete